MGFKKIVLSTVAGFSLLALPFAQNEDLDGRRAPPRAPEASLATSRGIDVAVLQDMVKGLSTEDTNAVLAFIDQLYSLKDKYAQVMAKEVELQQSSASNEAQKELMKQYVSLLQQEKDTARDVINTVSRDLEARESRLLQVMAKIFRIGDRGMKTVVGNIRLEIKKAIVFQLQNNQTANRDFYMDAMRFLDQYFN